MNKLTKVDCYKTDLPRLNTLKYELTPKPTSQDLLRLLIAEHYELQQLKKSQK